MNFEVKVTIKKPAAEIFSYISNFSNHAEMFAANIESKQTSDGPIQVGTTMQNIAKFMGISMTERFIVKEFIPNKLIYKESLPESTFITGDKMILEEINGETIFTTQVYAYPKGFLKLLDGFLGKQVKKSLIKDMNRLKKKFESTNS